MRLLCWLGLHNWWGRRAFGPGAIAVATRRVCSICLKQQRWVAYSNRTEGWENEP